MEKQIKIIPLTEFQKKNMRFTLKIMKKLS